MEIQNYKLKLNNEQYWNKNVHLDIKTTGKKVICTIK